MSLTQLLKFTLANDQFNSMTDALYLYQQLSKKEI